MTGLNFRGLPNCRRAGKGDITDIDCLGACVVRCLHAADRSGH
jgi:hypothetical protein